VAESDEDAAEHLADDMRHYVVEVDDEQEEDAQAAMADEHLPLGLSLVSADAPLPPACGADGPLLHAYAALPLLQPGGSDDMEEAGSASGTEAPPPGASRPLQLVVVALRMRWVDLAAPVAAILGAAPTDGDLFAQSAHRVVSAGGTVTSRESSTGSHLGHHAHAHTAVTVAPAALASAGVPLSHSTSHAGGHAGQHSWLAAALGGLSSTLSGIAAAATGGALAAEPADATDGRAGMELFSGRPGHAAGSASAGAAGGWSASSGTAGGAPSTVSDTERLAHLFSAAHGLLAYKVRLLAPATVCALRCQVSIPNPEEVEVLLTGTVVRGVGLWLPPSPDALAAASAPTLSAAEDGSSVEAGHAAVSLGLPPGHALVLGPGGVLQLPEWLRRERDLQLRMCLPAGVATAVLRGVASYCDALRGDMLRLLGWRADMVQRTEALLSAAAAAAAEEADDANAALIDLDAAPGEEGALSTDALEGGALAAVAGPAAHPGGAVATNAPSSALAILAADRAASAGQGSPPGRTHAAAAAEHASDAAGTSASRLSGLAIARGASAAAIAAATGSSSSDESSGGSSDGRTLARRIAANRRRQRAGGPTVHGSARYLGAAVAPGLPPRAPVHRHVSAPSLSSAGATGSPAGRLAAAGAATPEPNPLMVRGPRVGMGDGTPALTPLPPGALVGRGGRPFALEPSRAGHGPSAWWPPRRVEVTPCSHVPGARVVRYLGCINMSFIRESLAVRQGGGLSSFMHTLIAEANAVVRGHAAALGGNAVLNYRLTPRETTGRAARNQAYHLISISGDVAQVV
jgi:hypothetical protein